MERSLYGMVLLFVTGVQQIPADSPGIGYVDGAYRVGSDGDCVNSGSDGIMHDSYGYLSGHRRYFVECRCCRNYW